LGVLKRVLGIRFKVVVILRFGFNHKAHKGDAKGITIFGLTRCSAPEKFFATSLKDFSD
jgi:hypothetical protein